MMFMIFDKVQYSGKRVRQNLSGKLGEIVGRVANVPTEVVVDFGTGAYILDETELSHFQGHLKGEPGSEKEEKRRGPQVKARRPSRKEQAEDKS